MQRAVRWHPRSSPPQAPRAFRLRIAVSGVARNRCNANIEQRVIRSGFLSASAGWSRRRRTRIISAKSGASARRGRAASHDISRRAKSRGDRFGDPLRAISVAAGFRFRDRERGSRSAPATRCRFRGGRAQLSGVRRRADGRGCRDKSASTRRIAQEPRSARASIVKDTAPSDRASSPPRSGAPLPPKLATHESSRIGARVAKRRRPESRAATPSTAADHSAARATRARGSPRGIGTYARTDRQRSMLVARHRVDPGSRRAGLRERRVGRDPETRKPR